MRYFIAGVVTILLAGTAIATILWVLWLPRLDWGARRKPGVVEQTLAADILARWVRRNQKPSRNPFSPTPENLKSARTEYEEHCAACHELDGSGRNRFEADFYPPVSKLTGDVQKLPDSEIYFVVANGIRNTAMPAFGKDHSPADMWRTVLWVRHLANLSPREKAEIERQIEHATMRHENKMTSEHGIGATIQSP